MPTPAEIADAYQALARDFHPDLFRLRGEEVRDVARQIFERLEKAFGVLRDSVSRRKYLAELERTPLPAPANAQPAAGSDIPRLPQPNGLYFTGVFAPARPPLSASGRGIWPGHCSGAQAGELPQRLEAGRSIVRRRLTRTRWLRVWPNCAESVECEPTNPWVRISLGRFYAETGLPDDAIREFEAALGMSPGLADIEEEIRRLKGET